ncbi:MAG: methyl-accepting chemotaxis protein [Pseudomonadota bacterium]|nr:methyl-accepting chemotaxis protein [Pseudomonadota bacterium]
MVYATQGKLSKLGPRLEFLRKGTIGQQMGRVFNLFAILVLVIGAVAGIAAMRIEDRSSELADLTQVAFKTASMTRSVAKSKDDMGAYRARGFDNELIAASIAHAEDAMAIHEELRETANGLGPEFRSRMARLDTGLGRVTAIMGEVRDAPRNIVERESFLGPRYDEIDQTIEQIADLREFAAARVEQVSGDGLYEIQFLTAALAIGVLAALWLVLFGKKLVSVRIAAPIVAISDASERISMGESGVELPATNREDEIGTLLRSLNVLRAVQEEAVAQAEHEHRRELERERQAQEERKKQQDRYARQLHELADQFERTISEVATEVASASGQMHAAASALASNVETTSKSVSNANSNLKSSTSNITSAAGASDEFAMSISEVSRQAGSSSERAHRAADAARKADETIPVLTGTSERISQIVEVIARIAQRTNLLALNASIEAARGGEAGRGFAVVASEVKELATQTAKATEEVEGLIGEMQAATRESASALSAISEEVHELETSATAIATAVDQQAVAGQDLARSIDLAARDTQSVSETVDEVSGATLQSGSTASQMLASSASLSQQAGLLREQVADFLTKVRAA